MANQVHPAHSAANDIRDKFENMVTDMHAKMTEQRQEMLAGVNFTSLKAVQYTGDEQVAARNVGSAENDPAKGR